MNRLLLIASLFALAVPAAFAAPPAGQGKPAATPQASTPSASDLCKAQRRAIGMDAFRALYAQGGTPKAAMSACLSQQKPIVGIAAKNAAHACKAEQADAGFAAAHEGKSFAEYYGKNANDKNAFGKCVSAKAKADVEEQQAETTNAAKRCKAERADAGFAAAHGGKSFADYYGTNKNKRNAFGKCVSRLAKAQDD